MTDHLCRQDRRCKTRVKLDDGTFQAGGVENPGLCRPCESAGQSAIEQLYTDWLWLSIHLTQRQKGAAIPGTDEHPIPIRLDIDAIATSIVSETTRWARRVDPDFEPPKPDGETVKLAVKAIRIRFGTLIDQPPREFEDEFPLADGGDELRIVVLDGVDAVQRLWSLHLRARKAIGKNDTRTWLPDPCPYCGVKALTVAEKKPERLKYRTETNADENEKPQHDLVKCMGCRKVWDNDHFALLSDVLDYERKQIKETA